MEVATLKDKNATPTVAVKDPNRARRFYEGALALTQIHGEGPGAVVYKSGSGVTASAAQAMPTATARGNVRRHRDH